MKKPQGTGRVSFRLSQAENERDYLLNYVGKRRLNLFGMATNAF